MSISLLILIASSVILSSLVCWLLVRSRQQQIGQLELREEIAQLRDLLHAQGSGNMGLSRNFQQLEARLVGVGEQLKQLENDTSVGGGSALYRQAINLAVGGAEPTELTERFGLSRGEAELLVSFHQLTDQASDRAA